MQTHFPSAPVVEIIAELRWHEFLSQITSPDNTGNSIFSQPFINPSVDEGFINRFAGKIESFGYHSVERMMPPGFPAIPFQVTHRFRKSHVAQKPDNNFLYQLGSGVFTANAIQPYPGWQQFLPVIKDGVTSVIACQLKTQPFSSMILRYVNSFRKDLIGNNSVIEFIQNELGMNLTLPKSITNRAKLSEIKPNLNLRIPMDAIGGVLQLQLGEGKAIDQDVVILDMLVEVSQSIESNVEKVIECFEHAHTILKEIFLELTEKLHSKMNQPKTV